MQATKSYGFRGQMFPFLAGFIGMVAIMSSYFIARSHDPPDVAPFPQTDITHCGIKFPQYIPFRIGLLAIIPLFVITWQIAKNYLQILSYKYKGCLDPRLNNLGKIGFVASFSLAISTATISDGGDMNWTLHSIGATSFFIITIYNCFTIRAVYLQLWQYQHFCPKYSYLFKVTVKQVGYVLLGIQCFVWANILTSIGSLIQWLATFYIMGFFFSLGFDFRKMDLMLVRK